MSTSPAQVPEHKPSEDPNPLPGTYSSSPRRPIYQTETTGNYWTDVREAFKVCIHRLAFLPLFFFWLFRFRTDVLDMMGMYTIPVEIVAA